MADPFFFFSYSRKNAGDKLTKFYEDLEKAVGRNGFRDTRDIKLGYSWLPELSEALQKCQAFVAIWSPEYFESEYCGKEWYAFRCRYEETMKPGDDPPPLIFPVLWVPAEKMTLPAAAREVQYDHQDFPDAYRRRGLLEILSSDPAEYERVLQLVARKVRSARPDLSPHRTRFDFEATPNAFSDDADRAGRRERHLREQFAQYLNALWTRLSLLPIAQVSGQANRETIPLPAVYTALNVTAEIEPPGSDPRRPFVASYGLNLAPDYVWRLFDRAPSRRPLTALEAAAGCKHLLLLGAPGSGKSTFARYLALSMAGQILGKEDANISHLNREGEAWPHGALVPVFVELARFVQSESFPKSGKTGEAGHLFDYLKEGPGPTHPRMN